MFRDAFDIACKSDDSSDNDELPEHWVHVLTFGCLLRTKYFGWIRFCKRIGVPPLSQWRKLSGLRASAVRDQAVEGQVVHADGVHANDESCAAEGLCRVDQAAADDEGYRAGVLRDLSRWDSDLSRGRGLPCKQVAHLPVIIHRNVQIRARRQQARVPRRDPHLGQRPSAGQRMADERVPPVMDRERS